MKILKMGLWSEHRFDSLVRMTRESQQPSRSSADAVLATEPASLGAAELGAHLVALDELRCRVEAAWLVAVGEFAEQRGHEVDGGLSAAAWIAHRCEQSGTRARAQAKAACDLREMPATATAMRDGSLSPVKAELLARARRSVAAERFAEDEQFLIDTVRDLSVDHASTALRFWVAQIEAGSGADPLEADRARRHLYLARTFRGALDVRGRLDAEGGAVVSQAFDAVMDDLRRCEVDGEQVAVWQRRADALVEMARLTLAMRCPGGLATAASEGERASQVDRAAQPLLLGVIDLAALAAVRRDAKAVVGELEPGVPLEAETVRRLLCDSALAPAVVNGLGEPLDLGRASRNPSRGQRRALLLRDRCCVFPGCSRPGSFCDAHHLVHWTAGGSTNLDNLALLCRRHHHLVHEGGFALERTSGGSFRCRRPDGTELIDPRAGPRRPWRLAS